MDEGWIQVRLRRATRQRLREVAERLARASGMSAWNAAIEHPSPEQVVSMLLDQWERRQQNRKKEKKRD
jgi:hypothetical protein